MKRLPPYFKWRDGRPRWEPGPRLRTKWKGRDLKDVSGAWLSYGLAIDAAIAINAEVAAWRATGGKRRRPPTPTRKARSCRQLYELWINSPGFLRNAPATQLDYKSKAGIFLDLAVGDATSGFAGQTFGDVPVATLDPAILYGVWELLHDGRGHATANGVIRVASVMFSYARRKGWRADNPASQLGMEAVQPRLMLWLPLQVAAYVAKADALGHHSLGDAVVSALHSGQRQADVLHMPERLFDEHHLKLSQLRVKIRTRKTRALIDAPMTPQLQARVAAIKERRRLAGEGGNNVVDLNAPLIRREDTGAPHDKHSLGRLFREVRAALAAEVNDDGTPKHPGIAALTFADLRDTAVTRLALAGCTLPQIAAITGHSLQSITDIMKHYLVLQPQMADEAIAKLTAWLEREGIAL